MRSARGQQEINLPFATLQTAADERDEVQVRHQERGLEFGHSATFMPKPCSATTYSGMHAHVPVEESSSTTSVATAPRPTRPVGSLRPSTPPRCLPSRTRR